MWRRFADVFPVVLISLVEKVSLEVDIVVQLQCCFGDQAIGKKQHVVNRGIVSCGKADS